MNFTEIAQTRQSCRSYDARREVEQEKLNAILESRALPPRLATRSHTRSRSAAARLLSDLICK